MLAILPVLTLGVADCYSQGDGSAPPLDKFYFPVGLRVSAGGNVLYAVNSNFDLQYNGGTLQSYDLHLIRQHAVEIIKDPRALGRPDIPLIRRSTSPVNPCPALPPVIKEDATGERQPLGETCAPPVDSSFYFRDVGVIGAFATDLLISPPPAKLAPQGAQLPASNRNFDRLFMPVRGNASLTWANVVRDQANVPPGANYQPFLIRCGQDSSRRCNAAHQAGTNADDNTRKIVMPGEPFGVAMSEDGESLVITHQNDPKTSLFSTRLTKIQPDVGPEDETTKPVLDFVLEGMPYGGIGVAAVPHDDDAFAPGKKPLPAFLETMRISAEIDLLRRYPDSVASVGDDPTAQSNVGQGSSLRRPFLDREAVFPITASAGGYDSRGIVIDPTPRMACKARVAPAGGARTEADVQADKAACARKPARVFIANRSPASILVGDVGGPPDDGGVYNPDRVVIHTSIPLSAGPSRLYLAPIIDKDGTYALRVFAVCFDSAALFIYDPDTQTIENVLRVAPGPFAMAFDPFELQDVAEHKKVELGPEGIRPYRFGYLASFTESFVQMLDFDNTNASPTFERIVFTLGQPTQPKGS